MPSTAPTDRSLLPFPAPFPSPRPLADLLGVLRRETWERPEAAVEALLARAGDALGAGAVTLWRFDAPPAAPDAVAPDRVALAAHDAVPGPAADTLDVAVRVRGTLAAALRVVRPDAPAWTPEERAFLVGVADRLAPELLQAARPAGDADASYRTLFEHSSDAIWVHDLDTGAILDVNRAAVEMYGRTAEEQRAIGVEGLSAGVAPYRAEDAMAYVRRAAAGEPQRFEWMGYQKDGRPVWGEVRLRRVSIGGVDRLLATARDIADRKAAETALHQAYEALELRVAERTAELARSNAALAQEVAEHALAKEALLQRTRELEAIFQALPDIYFRLDADLRITDYRASTRDRLYVPPEVFLGRRLHDVMPPEVTDRFDVALAAAADDGLVAVEYRLHVDGALRDYEARFLPLGDGTRIGVVREITERMNAERALHEREAQLRETQRMARLGSWQWDVGANTLTWDPVLCGLYGLAPEQAPTDLESYLALVHPDDRALARGMAERALETLEPFAFDHRVLLPDGGVRHLHGRGNVVVDADGRPLRMAGSSQDVTEQKVAELALREREEHFRRLIENASDFVMTCDARGALTYVAPSSARMLGWEPREMVGTRPSDRLHPEDWAEAQRALAWLAEHPGETITTTFRVRHRSGEHRVFEYRARTISADTAAEGIIAFARDVTDRKLAEEALARAKEEAERANRAKSEFLSRMSHELRTPMNSILGFAQLLARAELPAAQGRSVQHILKAGRHLLHLINEVLEIARIEAGREHFSLEPVALAPALQEAVGLVRPLAQQAGVELREGAWPPEAFVHADRQRLVQVLLNLLSNAIKYNRPHGFVRLGCASQEEGRWTVRIEDGGPGIRADRVHQLFTPFARLGAESTEVEGTGLGLALSRRLSEAMGGTLALESTGATGSVFRLDLEAVTDPREQLEHTGVHAVPVAPHRAATLLYIEDNLANLSLVETILLSRPGWRTLPALQGQLGVELAREHLPDAILLDLHLPDINGDEVLRRLRADARTARIPVIVVSADATPTSVERLRVMGADAYLTKPLDVDEFLRVVERFLPKGTT